MAEHGDNRAPGFAKRPDYPITIEPAGSRVTVTFDGEVIADSENALLLRESTYPGVYYIPRSDVRMDRLSPTDKDTYCPFKGHAAYWTVADDRAPAENVVWSYEAPYDEMAQIRAMMAFWLSKDTRLDLKIGG